MNAQPSKTVTVRTNAELRAMNLSFYTLSKLANVLCCVNPMEALEARLARNPSLKGELTLDDCGNFLAFA